MIPDLGKYAHTVVSAYGASLGLLMLFLVLTVRRGRKVRRDLQAIEARVRRDG